MNNEDDNVKKEKSSGKTVAIVILILIILGLGGYICYDKGLLIQGKTISSEKESKENKNSEDCEKIEVLETNDEKVLDTINTISRGLGEYCGIWDYFTDKKVTVNDISNEKVANIVLASLYDNKIIESREGTTFTKDQFDSVVKKYFGKDYKYTHKSLTTTCPFYTYNEATATYTEGESGCGGTCGEKSQKRIVKVQKQGKTIEVYIRVLFSNLGDLDDVKYYKDYQKTQLANLEKDYDGRYVFNDKDFREGTLYKVTLTEEDGNYVFTSSEVANN